ncbi:hypothetical protein BCV70DRAFT_197208 [Testicularia cyperi]|uniref:Uncharacterized protein n=1 Tax=Testicularia cyperi TaxID=1882483 RepID=A0A317XYV7_9BASI|nr:hypothetical protein BCV70DRAFT_197208 [Testicularia cyperi]
MTGTTALPLSSQSNQHRLQQPGSSSSPASAVSSRSSRHEYPPAPSSASSAHRLANGSASAPTSDVATSHSTTCGCAEDGPSGSKNIVSYLVHSQTSGVSDTSLQVSFLPSSAHTRAKQKQPLRPAYLRERILTHRNEIVDKIVDASSGRVCWTIHRPTRGWYLYLRSPVLPPGSAISLRSAPVADHDPSVTPLSFTLTTRVRPQPLAHVTQRISSDGPTNSVTAPRSTANHNGDSLPLPAPSDSASVSMSGRPSAADEALSKSTDSTATEEVALATGREGSKPSSGHTRRRSAAGSGTHSVDTGKSHRSVALTRSPMIPEIQDEDSAEAGSPSKPAQISNKQLPRLDIPPSASFRAGADRPYSPTEPGKQPPGSASDKGLTPDTANQTCETFDVLRTCTFVLSDGGREACVAAASAAHASGENDSSNSGRAGQTAPIALKGKQGWARWMWSILPEELRPVLSMDTSKSFSLFWVDPPSLNTSASNNSGGKGTSIEVLRFEDQSGWWLWDSQTKGRLIIQQRAMESIGLEKEFWITTALAYLQFLEEKDGYEAAREA